MRSEGYVIWSTCMCVCVCLCLLFSHYVQQGGQKRYQRVQCHTGLIFKRVITVKPLGLKVMACKSQWVLPHLDRSLPLCTLWKHQKLLKGQVMSQRLHSNATYKYSYPVGARNGRLWVCGRGLYACVYIGGTCLHRRHMRVYHCVTHAVPCYTWKFSTPFGLSTCCIVVLGIHHRSLVILLPYYSHCSIIAEGSAL